MSPSDSQNAAPGDPDRSSLRETHRVSIMGGDRSQSRPGVELFFWWFGGVRLHPASRRVPGRRARQRLHVPGRAHQGADRRHAARCGDVRGVVGRPGRVARIPGVAGVPVRGGGGCSRCTRRPDWSASRAPATTLPAALPAAEAVTPAPHRARPAGGRRAAAAGRGAGLAEMPEPRSVVPEYAQDAGDETGTRAERTPS